MAVDGNELIKFSGQAWDSWVENIPLTIFYDGKSGVSVNISEAESMKLDKKDKNLFGHYPLIEELQLVGCELCGMWLKPQALKMHVEIRHGSFDLAKKSRNKLLKQNEVINSVHAKTVPLLHRHLNKTTISVLKTPTKASMRQSTCFSPVTTFSSSFVCTLAKATSADSFLCDSVLKTSTPNPVVRMERIKKDITGDGVSRECAAESADRVVSQSASQCIAKVNSHKDVDREIIGEVRCMKPVSKDISSSKQFASRCVLASSPLSAGVGVRLSFTSNSPALVTPRAVVVIPVSEANISEHSVSKASFPSQPEKPLAAAQPRHVPVLCSMSFSPSTHTVSMTPVSVVTTSAVATTNTTITYVHPQSSTGSSFLQNSVNDFSSKFSVLSKAEARTQASALTSALAVKLTAASNLFKPVGLDGDEPRPSAMTAKLKKHRKERKLLLCKDREFDPNKHCGVLVEGTGSQCTRSLTCKTHALGLRRAVHGRRKSLDDLLREHKDRKLTQLWLRQVSDKVASPSTLNSAVCTSSASLSLSGCEVPCCYSTDTHQTGNLCDIDSSSSSTLHHSLQPVKSVSKAVFQRITPGGPFHPCMSIKEEVSPFMDFGDAYSQSCSVERDENKKSDVSYISHQPRPVAQHAFATSLNIVVMLCTFGARMRNGYAAFSSKADLTCTAFATAVEHCLSPPPQKKLGVEFTLSDDRQTKCRTNDACQAKLLKFGPSDQHRNVRTPVVYNSVVKSHPTVNTKPTLSYQPASYSRSSSTWTTSTTIAIPALAAALSFQQPIKLLESPQGRQVGQSKADFLSLHNSLKRRHISSTHGGQSLPGAMMLQLASSSVGTMPALSEVSVAPMSALPVTMVNHGNDRQSENQVLTNLVTCGLSTVAFIPNITVQPATKAGNASSACVMLAKNSNSSLKCGNGGSELLKVVLTGFDGSMINGQRVNITGAQLAELAAAQAVSATVGDRNVKRSHLQVSRSRHGSGVHISGTGPRAFNASNVLGNVPHNAVPVDKGLRGVMLADFTKLSPMGGKNPVYPNLLTLTCMTGSVPCPPSLAGMSTVIGDVKNNPMSVQCNPCSPTITNGIISNSGGAIHSVVSSSSQIPHHCYLIATASTAPDPTIQTMPPTSIKSPATTRFLQAAALCPPILKTSGTYSIKDGLVTMQSVSVPIVTSIRAGVPASSLPPRVSAAQAGFVLAATSAVGSGCYLRTAAVCCQPNSSTPSDAEMMLQPAL